jgi:hypothetical protein
VLTATLSAFFSPEPRSAIRGTFRFAEKLVYHEKIKIRRAKRQEIVDERTSPPQTKKRAKKLNDDGFLVVLLQSPRYSNQ